MCGVFAKRGILCGSINSIMILISGDLMSHMNCMRFLSHFVRNVACTLFTCDVRRMAGYTLNLI